MHAEQGANAQATAEAYTDSFTFEDLLAESLQHQADTKALKEGRKALKERKSMPNADYEAMMADLKRIEKVREWLPRASVAMFQIQHCTCCDNYNPVFTGLFQRQTSRIHGGTERWVAASESENRGLKREVKTTEINIPFCGMCLAQNNWPAEQLGITFDADDEASDIPPALAAIESDNTLTDEEKLQAEFEAYADEHAEEAQRPV